MASDVFGAISNKGIQSSVGIILSTLLPQKLTDEILMCLLSSLIYKNPITLWNGYVNIDRARPPVRPEKI